MTAQIRRFWTSAAIVPHADGWAVALDGKVALTPARAALATRHQRLAQAVAAEWARASDPADPRAMPLTGFLNAIIDRVRPNRQALAADVAKFSAAELICYRADAPEALVRRQAEGWDPVLNWMATRYDVRLACGIGVTPFSQSAAALARLFGAVAALDDYRLAAAVKLTGLSKSLALTLAAVESAYDAAAVYELSRIDEAFQTERWGEDAEAARRVAREREEAAETGSFLGLLD